MTPHLQLNRHDPAAGVYGDCFRTAIACLLDLEPAEVPHYAAEHAHDGDAHDAAVRGWLAGRGLNLIGVPFDGSVPRDELLACVAHRSGAAGRFILGGLSPRGVPHVAIATPAGIEHDPAGGDQAAAIVAPMPDGFWWVYWLGALL